MLAGVLVLTSGTVHVSGRIPYQNRRENAKQIGVVFGQRSQLYWSLPIIETHDMDDIEHICNRIITIDKGNIIYDGTKDSFKETFGSGHLIEVEFYSDDVVINNPLIRLVKDNNTCKSYLINPREISVAEAVSTIARQNNIKDIKLQEPTIEDAVKRIHQT